MKSIAIVGCGPSGLLAAHAVHKLGVMPVIYATEKKPSRLWGAMYLHESIEGLTNERPDALITILKDGTAEGYAKKVYGDADHPVSWHHFSEGDSPMWSLRVAYERLWMMYKNRIRSREINHIGLHELTQEFSAVICTAPKPRFCLQPDKHLFTSQPIWIRVVNNKYLEGNLMAYNGREEIPWYRMSHIDNILSFEYAAKPPFQGLLEGKKPIENNCDCWPTVLWTGRFGSWTKGVLTHHVFNQVHDALFAVL